MRFISSGFILAALRHAGPVRYCPFHELVAGVRIRTDMDACRRIRFLSVLYQSSGANDLLHELLLAGRYFPIYHVHFLYVPYILT